MIIEIKGIGMHNTGSQMMLLTILQKLEKDAHQFVIPHRLGSCVYSFYSRSGIHPKISFSPFGVPLGWYGVFIPKRVRKTYGLITDTEIGAVIDASGFAYSSQWGEGATRTMAHYSKKKKKMGNKIILMPQAFGPFTTASIRKNMRDIIKSADRIYARDVHSYQALMEIDNKTSNIRLSADFTILLEGLTPEYFNPSIHQICLVPNQRMIDKHENNESYKGLITVAIDIVQKNGFSPYFLIHGGKEDLLLADKINSMLKKAIPIVNELDPRLVKGLIQNSMGLVGSRYHALASALYSGVVAIGTGWSHKYQYLFEETGFPEGLIEADIARSELEQKINLICDTRSRSQIKEKLIGRRKGMIEKTQLMFNDIKLLLEGK